MGNYLSPLQPLTPLDANGIETPLAPARPIDGTNNSIIPPFDPTTGNPIYGGVQINPDNTVTVTTPQGSQTGAVTGTGLFSGIEQWILSEQANWVAILVGLVLIAGAVWGFSTVRDTVTGTVRSAATIAAA